MSHVRAGMVCTTSSTAGWLIRARPKLVLWTSDTGIDGQTPIELDELDHLIAIEPLPSRIWYRDMADYQRQPELIADWHGFRDARVRQRAVDWLVEHELVAPPAED